MVFYIKIITKLFFLLLGIDGIWLSCMGTRFYKPYLAHVFSEKFAYGYAIIFYLLYAIAIAHFVVIPYCNQSELQFTKVFLDGLFLGFVVYAAYDLTNQATIKNWPIIVTIVDMVWGSVLTGIVACLVYKHTAS